VSRTKKTRKNATGNRNKKNAVSEHTGFPRDITEHIVSVYLDRCKERGVPLPKKTKPQLEKMVEEVHNWTLQKADPKSSSVQRFKKDRAVPTLDALAIHAFSFNTINSLARETHLSSTFGELIVLIENEIISRFAKEGRIADLKAIIKDGEDTLYEGRAPGIEVFNCSFGFAPVTGIISTREYESLFLLLSEGSPFPIRRAVFSALLDCSGVEKADCAQEEAAAMVRRLISPSARKEALSLFYDAVGETETHLLETLYSQQVPQTLMPQTPPPLPSRNLFQPPSLEEDISHNGVISSVFDEIRAWLPALSNEFAAPERATRRKFPTLFSSPGKVALGFYCAAMKNELWEASSAATAVVFGCSTRAPTFVRDFFASTIASLETDEEDMAMSLPENLRAAVETALHLFDRPDEAFSFDETASQEGPTNGQVLSLMGFSVLSPQRTFPDPAKLITQACARLSSATPLTETLAAAAAAVYFLEESGLLSRRAEDIADLQSAVDHLKEAVEKIEQEKGRLLATLEERTRNITLLEESVERLKKRLSDKDAEIDNLYNQKNALKEHTDHLLEVIASLSEGEEQEESPSGQQFPASLHGKKVLSFGGFTSFLGPLQEMLPELVIYQSSRRPEANTIKAADAVFIQTNRVSHPDFYYVLDTCRDNNIPVEVYKTAGARSCALQVLSLVEKLQQKDTLA